MYSRVYAAIDLDAIHYNMEKMHELIKKDTKMMAVIKTDGYGHGAVEIAHEVENYEYLFGFATATVSEAEILRRNGIKKPILILGYTFEEEFDRMVEAEIRPAVSTLEMAKRLSEHAKRLKRTLKIHIALDTGMSRIGFQITEQSAREICEISKLEHLEIEGMFTHFAKADETDKTAAHRQLQLYQNMVDMLRDKGVEIPYLHCSNSAGIIDLEEANLNMVRAGITIYGLWPSSEVQKERLPMRPVLSLYSQVVHVKTLEPGREISYGGTYTTEQNRVIATIPVGYGDGYARGLSNKGYVLIHGQKAPIRGRVCMDQFMVDVTDIQNVKPGDKVTLVGTDGNNQITLEELGELSGRFNYEFACCLGKRIPRVFYKNGAVVGTKDYFAE